MRCEHCKGNIGIDMFGWGMCGLFPMPHLKTYPTLPHGSPVAVCNKPECALGALGLWPGQSRKPTNLSLVPPPSGA